MAGSISAAPGRIFISYRREETAYPAGWLFDRLADRFGEGQVFKDVDSIELGDDFVEVITTAVGSCDVLLALIGEEWLTVTDPHGRRRLDDPDDFVRLEIEAALTRNVRVIPILVDGARMPRTDELPDSLARLVRRQALELSPSRFDFDTSRLLKVLDKTLVEVRTAERDAAALRAPPGKAPDPSTTEVPEAAERRGQASTPSIPPAAPATRPRMLAGAGVGVVLILLIVAVVANPDTPSPPTQAAAITTTPPAQAVVTTAPPPPTKAVVFQDNFSSQANAWDDDGSQPLVGRYVKGAYRISAAPTPPNGGGAGSLPQKARRVFPSAPPSIRIEVEARRLAGSDLESEYGILCRANPDTAYIFTISDGFAKVAKAGATYEELKRASVPIDADAKNRLQAVCSSAEGAKAVRLALSVNGRKVAEATDRANPFTTGTVGIFVGIGPGARKAAQAEFDNFVVTRV